MEFFSIKELVMLMPGVSMFLLGISLEQIRGEDYFSGVSFLIISGVLIIFMLGILIILNIMYIIVGVFTLALMVAEYLYHEDTLSSIVAFIAATIVYFWGNMYEVYLGDMRNFSHIIIERSIFRFFFKNGIIINMRCSSCIY